MSDQERDKLVKETDDEGSDDVEGHKLMKKLPNKLPHQDEDGDDGDDVEAHKLPH